MSSVLDALAFAASLYLAVYPVLMSFVWMGGAWYFYSRFERTQSDPTRIPKLRQVPKVALVVPCYNEEANVWETVENLLAHDYPDFEVIAINDGSKDRTGELLDQLMDLHPRLRVIHQAKNQGKAMGLRMAALATDADLLLCIDGDALLSPHAARWMARHFEQDASLGAVTGNPRLRTRSTLLGRIQVGEFSAIIGLIKRAQRVYGRLFTVSGVCAMFRRAALHDVGYWSTDMLCEDIDISWKLQLAGWNIRFEPAATVWILMPETVNGLWKQRLRWAMGGVQALIRYAGMWKRWDQRAMWPVYFEFICSMLWAYLMATTLVLNALTTVADFAGWVHWPHWLRVDSVLPGWAGICIAWVNIVQTMLSLWLDRRYDKRLWHNIAWSAWYPLAFWLLTMATTVIAVPKVLRRRAGQRAVWVSPDRGVQQ